MWWNSVFTYLVLQRLNTFLATEGLLACESEDFPAKPPCHGRLRHMQTCKADALVRVAQLGLAGKCEFGLQSIIPAHHRGIPTAVVSDGTPEEFAHSLPPSYQKHPRRGWTEWVHGTATHWAKRIGLRKIHSNHCSDLLFFSPQAVFRKYGHVPNWSVIPWTAAEGVNT